MPFWHDLPLPGRTSLPLHFTSAKAALASGSTSRPAALFPKKSLFIGRTRDRHVAPVLQAVGRKWNTLYVGLNAIEVLQPLRIRCVLMAATAPMIALTSEAQALPLHDLAGPRKLVFWDNKMSADLLAAAREQPADGQVLVQPRSADEICYGESKLLLRSASLKRLLTSHCSARSRFASETRRAEHRHHRLQRGSTRPPQRSLPSCRRPAINPRRRGIA